MAVIRNPPGTVPFNNFSSDVSRRISDVKRRNEELGQSLTTLDSTAQKRGQPVEAPVYTVGTLPAVPTTNAAIFVSDASGGPTIAISDGTNWIDVRTGVAVV